MITAPVKHRLSGISPRAAARRPVTVIAASKANRSVVILPGLGNAAGDYQNLATTLKDAYGFNVEIAPVSRIDWARNAAGLLDGNYWTGTLSPRPTVDWYLNRIQIAIDSVKQTAGDSPITLLSHSAGGWLGRLYMLDFGTDGIDQFVSLGSPHLPPPPGVIDQTRGILTFVEKNCPGAYHAPDVRYVTIAGKYIRGAPLLGKGSIAQKIVGAGYQQVCGDAEVDGDGVVPLPSAHLEGALNITLEGVYHSPLGAEDPGSDQRPADEEEAMQDAFKQEQGAAVYYDTDDYEVGTGEVAQAAQEVNVPGPRLWYGSAGILEQWVDVLVKPDDAVPSKSSS